MKKRKSWYGLRWEDDNTLIGEMLEKEFAEKAFQYAKADREMFPDQVSILRMTSFERLCGSLNMDFRLQIRRNFCSGGTIFNERHARILPGPASEPIVERLRDIGRKRCANLLKYEDYALEAPGASLRERVEGLILLAEKDIRWCSKEGAELLKKSKRKKPLAGLKKVKIINKKRERARKK